MATQNLIVLSYHQFFEDENRYAFSRTFRQFANDLGTKDFDWLTMDDGHIGIIKACEMMQEKNFRAKIFITTALVGSSPDYVTWDDLWKLSKYHDIENHSYQHVKLTELSDELIHDQIAKANADIKKYIGVRPRYFVPPWNQANESVLHMAEHLGLQIVRGRTDIKNDSR